MSPRSISITIGPPCKEDVVLNEYSSSRCSNSLINNGKWHNGMIRSSQTYIRTSALIKIMNSYTWLEKRNLHSDTVLEHMSQRLYSMSLCC